MSRKSQSFQQQLAALAQRIGPQYRQRTADNIQMLLDNGVSSFRALLKSVNDDTKPLEARVTACWLLPRLKPTKRQQEQIADALLSLFSAEDADLRYQAVIGVGDLHIVSDDAIRALEALIDSSSDVETRKLAVYSYGRIANSEGVDILISVIRNQAEDASLRGMAVEAVSNIGDGSLAPMLIDLLSDPSDEVRFWSAFSLGIVGGEDAIPALMRLANEDHKVLPGWGSVSDEAVNAIENIKRSSIVIE